MTETAQAHANSLARKRLLAPMSSFTGKVQALGIGILGSMIVLAIFAPVFTGYGPKDLVCAPFQVPVSRHWLGCNDVGQDLWAQLIYGARTSLFVGISVALVSTTLATLLALIAGFCAGAVKGTRRFILDGSWIDQIIMRCVDVSLSLPFLPLVIVLGVYFGASIQTQIIVITLVMWAHPVRELRAQTLSIRSAAFVEASKTMGAGGMFIVFRHILPELAPLIVPQFVRIAHNAILIETSLSFLGLGDPLQNSWGSTLYHANARAAFLTGSWTYWIVPPGLAVGLAVLSFAFMGYGFDASLGSKGLRLSRRKIAADDKKLTSVPKQPHAASSYLDIEDLTIDYPTDNGVIQAVCHVDLSLNKGELLGLVGESGSGKTSLAMAILQLLREPAPISSGAIHFNGQNLLHMSASEMRKLRSQKIALIPQSAMNALNPVLSIGDQLEEALALSGQTEPQNRKTEAVTWMERVGLDAKHLAYYPHELSGGMRQRAVIAIALCKKPELVIADEPTTGLDVLVQEEIMQLLVLLRRDMQLSILFVTHNLPLIARHCDRLAVMLSGQIVEAGLPATLQSGSMHFHTQALFKNLPKLDERKRWSVPVTEATDTSSLPSIQPPLLELRSVSKSFTSASGRLTRMFSAPPTLKAVDSISMRLNVGETLGLVGASGAGKSTIARLITGQIRPDEGQVLIQDSDRHTLSEAEWQDAHRIVHMVFQDPYQSLNNRMPIIDLVSEPLYIQGYKRSPELIERVRTALRAVQLPDDDAFLTRLPVFLSGGQRQRVAFARAIIGEPKLIIADEPTSMLDQSIRIEIMNLMERLQREFGTAFLLITHDIVLARHFCQRLMVLHNGRLVEEGEADAIVQNPRQAYTRALIAAA